MRWSKITKGETVIVEQDFKRFKEGVTFVLLPYFHNGSLSAAYSGRPQLEGLREAISQMNQYLLYTVLTAFSVSLLT